MTYSRDTKDKVIKKRVRVHRRDTKEQIKVDSVNARKKGNEMVI